MAPRRFLILFWRRYLPWSLCIIGTVLLIINGTGVFGVDAFAAFVGAGLSVALTNVLWRIGVAGNVDRDDEEDARRYLAEHGHWPSDRPRLPDPEPPPAPTPAPAPAAPVHDGADARREWERQHRRR